MKTAFTVTVEITRTDESPIRGYTTERTFQFADAIERTAFINVAETSSFMKVKGYNVAHLLTAMEAVAECESEARR